jgi:hypothetical protein
MAALLGSYARSMSTFDSYGELARRFSALAPYPSPQAALLAPREARPAMRDALARAYVETRGAGGDPFLPLLACLLRPALLKLAGAAGADPGDIIERLLRAVLAGEPHLVSRLREHFHTRRRTERRRLLADPALAVRMPGDAEARSRDEREHGRRYFAEALAEARLSQEAARDLAPDPLLRKLLRRAKERAGLDDADFALLARAAEGERARELAAQAGVSEAGIWQRLARARRRLADAISALEAERGAAPGETAARARAAGAAERAPAAPRGRRPAPPAPRHQGAPAATRAA